MMPSYRTVISESVNYHGVLVSPGDFEVMLFLLETSAQYALESTSSKKVLMKLSFESSRRQREFSAGLTINHHERENGLLVTGGSSELLSHTVFACRMIFRTF